MQEYFSMKMSYRPPQQKGKLFAGIVGSSLILTTSLAAELPAPPPGATPVVQAEENDLFADAGHSPVVGEDKAIPKPNHPPIDEIPSMPMPDDSDVSRVFIDTGPGQPVYFDQRTEKETLGNLPGKKQLDAMPDHGGGYQGADVGNSTNNPVADERDILPATFNTKLRIGNYISDPWRKNVKLVMHFQDSHGTNYYRSCSGAMRDAEVVQTAGHCVYNRSHNWGWAKEVWVYPAYDGDWDAFGYGKSEKLASLTGWTDEGNTNYDMGAVVISRAVGMLTGWFGWFSAGCSTDLGKTWNNASYPAEDCGQPGLHNGRDLYYWSGTFDSCPDTNLRQIDTTGGCFDALWGGESGSAAYFKYNNGRYIGAVASTSNRSTIARYAAITQTWVSFLNNTIIPNDARGSTFDIQPLHTRLDEVNITSGDTTTGLKHTASNPTNGTSASAARYFKVYLSTNDNISTADTLLSTQVYTRAFAAMQNVTINMTDVKIPLETQTGNYWLGVIYNNGTDGNDSNNDTDEWDAARIHVTQRQTFDDVPTDFWAWLEIEKLVANGITSGCDAHNYCPGSPVNRAQMAVFLERGMHGGSYTPPPATGSVFHDVSVDTWGAAWIEQLADDGITGGCGNGNYCPNGIVSRAQMAVFLLRAKHGASYVPPAATGTIFNDVPANAWGAAWIEQLASEGITGGCGGGNYCPNANVNRDQMAVFLTRTFNL